MDESGNMVLISLTGNSCWGTGVNSGHTEKKIQEDLGASHVPASEAQMDTVSPQGPWFQTLR